MVESLLDRIYKLIELEYENERLEKISKSFYTDVAIHVNKMNEEIYQSEKSIRSNLAIKERKMILDLIDRLIDLRIKKAYNLDDTEMLTAEERYIIEPLTQSAKKLKKVIKAIENGQSSRLEKISDIISSRLTKVKFLKPIPSIMGIDLKIYGPFKEEDIAVIPLENAKPLINQNIIIDVWIDDL